ncbi:hypothetical protein USDA257_c03650 [Sinorhizobium fredii USDA 257]|uniref:Uncharacterized protein n=1 Tax=Sinorhizobium fredii (strain USDA 257) TaxID=1185652 RepID=I3WZA7_SINF2|nr:hypothetical protein USDA257_c03650 [Sinorhizobium fredii USDA 257]
MSLPLQNFRYSAFDNIYMFTAPHCQTQDKVTPFSLAMQE